jgi:hypothetical protein
MMNAMAIVSGTPYTLIVRGTPTATCFQGKLYNWVYYTMATAASPINDSFEPYLMLPYDSRSYYAQTYSISYLVATSTPASLGNPFLPPIPRPADQSIIRTI